MKKPIAMGLWALLCLLVLPAPRTMNAQTGIVGTRHNLSVTGPGELKALSETRICIFCHTPHNAQPATPLWNKQIDARIYSTYTSSTMGATPGQPTGPSRLCLSCHDGTVALGAVLHPSSGIAMSASGGIPANRSSYLGTSLFDDHPVSFSYYDSLPDPELLEAPPAALLFYENGMVHCSTCHDPHNDQNSKLLSMSNEYSALCVTCHKTAGWQESSHRTSLQTWTGQAPNPWPRTGAGTEFNWTTVAQNGCGSCHAPHSAGGPKRLLSCYGPECTPFTEEGNCAPCHNGNAASRNVISQFNKPSRHSLDSATDVHDPREDPRMIVNHVECVDCHNPHASRPGAGQPPGVSGRQERVSGVDAGGTVRFPAANEYEVCFKCHADSVPFKSFSAGFPVQRVVNTTNTRIEFSTANPSYHPVISYGRNSDVPSLPSSLAPPEWNLSASSIIRCTDCHDSDETAALGGAGPRGPHGSLYSPLLREAYETADNTLESIGSFALCYRCHERSSILADISFQKTTSAGKGGHSLHLGPAVNAPCSACHDPHGVPDKALTGDHTHLMNFDTTIVTAQGTNPYPFFTDLGSRSGSCTLSCHGQLHDGRSYP